MKNSKNGVAVIIVLGLLALLMVLGVAFSVSMRVERAGAANYSSAARTRQMVWAGLARAIGDINQTTANAYPDGDFLASGGSWGTNNTSSGVRLLTGKARDYVPKVFLDLGYDNERSQWLPLGVSNDDREGYAAYMVLNLSDMLDANHVGGAVREGGTNVAEIVLNGIPWSAPFNVATMVTERQNDGPFESLPEFSERTGLPNDVLSTYSRYPRDYNRTNAVYIGGTVDDLIANQTEIIEHIRQVAGISLPNQHMAAGIFTNLLDYLDEDSIPRNLAGPGVEAVPMLNEVAMTNVMFVAPVGNTLNAVAIRGGIETWYPFVQMNQAGLAFRLNGAYTMSLTVTDVDGGGVVLASVSSNATFQSSALPYGTSGSASFSYHPFIAAVVIGGGAAVTNNPEVVLAVSVSNLAVTVVGAGDVVDRVNGVFSFSATGRYNAFPSMTPVAYQTLDPRFNWSSVPYWPVAAVSTIGTTNTQTQVLLAMPTYKGGDRLHCSDRGRLYSPLELGNLPRNIDVSSILQTLRVFNHGASQPRDPILEHFTTAEDAVQRGLVNVNTRDTSILEAAFRDMPHPYVGAPPLAPATRTAVLDLFVAAQTNGTFFGSLTDVLQLDWRTALPALSDLEREALVAYSSGLMGVRQNLFLIVVSASAAGQQMGRLAGAQAQVMHRGRQRALALVWRDPVANAQGLHDCFVQHFQWLD